MACQKCQNFWLSLLVIAGIMLLVATLYTPPEGE